jgi:hypothetical protein
MPENCIPENIIDDFFDKITPEKLAEMDAKARQKIYNDSFGVNMGSKVSLLTDPVFTKTLKNILTTEAERKIIYEKSQKLKELFKNYDITNQEWKNPEIEAEYGATVYKFKQYIDNIKNNNLPIKGMLKEYSKEIRNLFKTDRFAAIKKVINDSISTLSKTMINAVSTWDNSWLGRQGAITLIKSPKTWMSMARKSMSDFYQTIKGNDPQEALMARVYSHPDYINGNFKKAELNFGVEEEVPIKLIERLPIIGRIIKASDISFIDSAVRARMGLWDVMKVADKAYKLKHPNFVEPTTSITGLRDRGKIINSITARGKTGKILGGEPTSLLLWAPKMMKADWDILTGHTFGFGLETKGARIEAVKTIASVVIVTAAITAIARAMGADVEDDPRSTDFLKIKIGDTRINTPFMRGMPQLVVLFSRLATQETKNSSGIINKLNSGEYGSKTLFDVGIDFLVNKTTPPAGAVLSWMRNRDFKGDKPTIGSTAFGFLPISVQNFIGLKDDSSTPAVFGAFADVFGISSNTYSLEKDWGEDTGKQLEQFKVKVGEDKFKEANDKFNKEYQEWFAKIKTNSQYTSLPSDRRAQVLKNKKEEIKNKIMRSYGFRYKQEKSKPLPKF